VRWENTLNDFRRTLEQIYKSHAVVAASKALLHEIEGGKAAVRLTS
jgi:hypothetical protein